MKKYKLSFDYDFNYGYIAAKEIVDYATDQELQEFTREEWEDLAAQRVDNWFNYGSCDIDEVIFYRAYRNDMVTQVTERVLQLVKDLQDLQVGGIEEIRQ